MTLKRSDFPAGDEGLRQYNKEWRKTRKSSYNAEQRKQYNQTNSAKLLARQKVYYEANRAAHIERVDERRRNIHTLDLPGIKQQIRAIYAEARRMTIETGVIHTVDHIWPINGKRSCGLHVPWNMQILTKTANDAKGNKEPK